ncbi:MAG: hypothetical protein M3Y41_19830 [Pseudomonadota bacterium]|nr:hypothetical protein [Pseudomonadota bacterium]
MLGGFGRLKLAIHLEEIFGVELPDEVGERFVTIGDIVNCFSRPYLGRVEIPTLAVASQTSRPHTAAPQRLVNRSVEGAGRARLDAVIAGAGVLDAADLFREGRLGMGWSQAALARTVLVQEEMLRDWESGTRPIPARVLAWVAMYAQSCPMTSSQAAKAAAETDQLVPMSLQF